MIGYGGKLQRILLKLPDIPKVKRGQPHPQHTCWSGHDYDHDDGNLINYCDLSADTNKATEVCHTCAPVPKIVFVIIPGIIIIIVIIDIIVKRYDHTCAPISRITIFMKSLSLLTLLSLLGSVISYLQGLF